MTIDESINRVQRLNLDDLAAAAESIAMRGRTVAEFAAHSDPQSLEEARAVGQILIEQLQEERARLLTELRNAKSIHDSLASNIAVDCRKNSLLGSILLG